MNANKNPKLVFYIIAFSELMTIPILVVMAFFLKNSKALEVKDADPNFLKMLFFIFLGISIFEFFFMILFSNKIKSEKEKGTLVTSKELSLRIVLMAFGIAPSVYGFFLFLMSMDMNNIYIFASISLVLTAIFFPKGEFLEERT